MKNPSFLPLFVFLSFWNAPAVFSQGLSFEIDSAQVASGQTVCVPVYARGFNNVISYQYSMSWNPQVLTFDHAQNFNLPSLDAADFNEYPSNILLTAWDSQTGQGVSRADGTMMFELCFTAIGSVGSNTEVSIGSVFPPSVGPAEAYNAMGDNIWAPNDNVFGFVEITASSSVSEADARYPSFLLTPNPTADEAKIKARFPSAMPVTIVISDVNGRVVYEKKRSAKAGEQTFEIPASALTAKGLYHVSLKTEQGVISQTLSVL
jgi:hypothetical protein